MLDGVMEYQKQGLAPPQCVTEATESYFEDEDVLQQWIADRCVTGPDFQNPVGTAFSSWRTWAANANLWVGNTKEFKSRMEAAGHPNHKNGTHGRHYRFIKIDPDKAKQPEMGI